MCYEMPTIAESSAGERTPSSSAYGGSPCVRAGGGGGHGGGGVGLGADQETAGPSGGAPSPMPRKGSGGVSPRPRLGSLTAVVRRSSTPSELLVPGAELLEAAGLELIVVDPMGGGGGGGGGDGVSGGDPDDGDAKAAAAAAASAAVAASAQAPQQQQHELQLAILRQLEDRMVRSLSVTLGARIDRLATDVAGLRRDVSELSELRTTTPRAAEGGGGSSAQLFKGLFGGPE